MGIHGLSQFLKKKYPQLFEPCHISDYAFKKVAVDTSLYMCAFKAKNKDKWIQTFIQFVAMLRKNEVHPVFIFDTKAPKEKEEERKRRKDNRDKQEERVFLLEDAIQKYHETGEVEKILLDFQEKRKLVQLSLLNPSKNTLNINAIEFQVKKMRENLFMLVPEDFLLVKEIFKIIDIPCVDAPWEAETMASDLCKKGKVDAVLTEDTDVLAYACPHFLSKVNPYDGSCTKIEYSKLLKEMNMSSDQFLDFCIMCHTDYNTNIPDIGPVKACKIIQECKSIDNIKHLDTSILNHIRMRELFRKYEVMDIDVPYVGTPDFQAFSLFSIKKNLALNLEHLKKSFIHNVVIIEDDPENDGDENVVIEDEDDVIIVEDE